MRTPFAILLIVTLICSGTLWYHKTASVCPVPLGYKVGTVAPEFNLTQEQIRTHLEKAEVVWEEATGRELFFYDDGGSLTVNFVFDERQANTDAQTLQKQTLDGKKRENESLIERIEYFEKEYESVGNSYERRVSEYEKKLTEYNERVRSYNDQGGAPQDIYQSLEAEKTTLNREADELNQTASELNQLAQTINELGENSNKLIDVYNWEVAVYNDQYGFSREFTQGDYFNNEINMYSFANKDELVAVLAHEFGHALGLDHVEGRSSIMYYLLETTSSFPTLTENDTAAFQELCGDGTEFSNRFRQFIRIAATTLTT